MGLNVKVNYQIILVIALLILLPILFIAPNVYSATEHPEGLVEQPVFLNGDADKFILIILDGVGTDVMLDEDMMPLLNNNLDKYAKLSVTTGPLTLSATCVKEMMTGVPNDPVDGLNNFDLKHPGGMDPWLLAAADNNNSVVMIGSYVMGNMYDSAEGIEYIYTFKGHSDYYEGDDETLEFVLSINQNNSFDTVAAHFSGPDKVGHTWGIDSQEYADRMIETDKQVDQIVQALGNDWNIIITADHGMTESGTHGSAELVTRDVTALIKGPRIVPQTYQQAHQRDISALTAVLLHQPLPVQLNGRIPVDILAYSNEEKAAIESWNWQAAKQRYEFFNSDSKDLIDGKYDWDLVSDDTKFDDSEDWILVSLIWLGAVVFCLLYFKAQMSVGRMFALETITFVSFVAILVYSQSRLDFSAMIPRGLGAACSVYLASSALAEYVDQRRQSIEPNPLISLILSPIIIPYLVLICLIFTNDISKSVVIGTMVWAVTYPLYRFQYKSKQDSRLHFSPGFYWVMALACFTFSGLRLWFMLIPMFFFAVKSIVDRWRVKTHRYENIQTIILSLLLFISLIFVNNRITGFHIMNRILKLGWPTGIVSGGVLCAMLLVAVYIGSLIAREKYDTGRVSKYCLLVIFCFTSHLIESSLFDRVVIVVLLACYLLSIKQYFSDETKGEITDSLRVVLASHMLVIWGAWAAVIVLLLIPCMAIMVGKFAEKTADLRFDYSNPKVFIAMALTPWMIWVLWWTLLGQVNGVQTCAEGICPHPRELDLGRIQVRGGYFGDRVNPHLNWMILMIATPILLMSTWLMYTVRSAGMSLLPYMISQVLLVLGSLNVLSFSADSPRLLFSVTWNIVFALFQIGFALAAELLFRYVSKSQKNINTIDVVSA